MAVVFAGLPDAYESEGYDRTHMRMPDSQNRLIEAVAEANPNTVVVLHNGSPVEMPWIGKVKGVLEAYLGGQAVGLAEVRVLFGDVNPSGHLPESFPVKLEDNPSYLFFGGEPCGTEYREGIFVGYRYYDKKKMDVLFPFGYGLSYTTFEYSGLKLSADAIKDTDTVTATVTVKNTGSRAGKAVVQLYAGDAEGFVNAVRPVRELRAFKKVALEPGESKEVSFTLGKRAFATWRSEIHDWWVETGDFTIEVGDSVANLDGEGGIHGAAAASFRHGQHRDGHDGRSQGEGCPRTPDAERGGALRRRRRRRSIHRSHLRRDEHGHDAVYARAHHARLQQRGFQRGNGTRPAEEDERITPEPKTKPGSGSFRCPDSETKRF